LACARRTRLTTVSALLNSPVTLEPQADGKIVACFEGHSVSLGAFSAGVADRARDLQTGLPLVSFTSGRRSADKELDLLVRRLARHGLLVYRVARSQQNDQEQAIIEPQIRTTGRRSRNSATPTFSFCRGLPTCGVAATRWSWSRRALARCFKFVIPRSRP
jgi:hypothetical protein